MNFTWPSITTSSGPVQYVLDGVTTQVSQDTGTPANSDPLPTLILDPSGVPVGDFATSAKQDAQTAELVLANASLDAIEATNATLAGVDFATETTLSSIDTKTPALVGGAVPVTGPLTDTQLRAAPVQIGNGTLSITNSVSSATTLIDAVDLRLYSAVYVQLAFTGTATVTFQGSNDNVTFYSVPYGLNSNAGLGSTVSGTSGIYWVPLNFIYFRLTVTAYTSGTITATCLARQSTGYDLSYRGVTVTNVANQNLLNVGGTTVLTGNGVTGAGSQRVTIASDNSPVPISGTVTTGGLTDAQLRAAPVPVSGSLSVTAGDWVDKSTLDFSANNVTSSAYTQLTASLAAAVTQIQVYNTTSEVLILATGAAAAEVDKLYIMPGGVESLQPIAITSSTRVSLKSAGATVSSGKIFINYFG